MLIERLADEHHPDTNYTDIFLLSYRYLISPATFIDKLTIRYNVVPPPNPTQEQLEYFNKYESVIKVRVLGVLKKWIDQYWTDFETNSRVFEKLLSFLDELEREKDVSLANLGKRLRKIISEKQKQSKILLAYTGLPIFFLFFSSSFLLLLFFFFFFLSSFFLC